MCYIDILTPNVNLCSPCSQILPVQRAGSSETADGNKFEEICKEGEQLENYTKYKLKAEEELRGILAGADNLFVIACNKCFKEFETVDEPDCETFVKIAAEQGKKITGCAKVDFLCNKTQTLKKMEDLVPEGTENIAVISCGLGIQTVADMVDVPVVAASNTLNYTGHHGMALTKKACDACAQCYLNPRLVGGICRIAICQTLQIQR